MRIPFPLGFPPYPGALLVWGISARLSSCPDLRVRDVACGPRCDFWFLFLVAHVQVRRHFDVGQRKQVMRIIDASSSSDGG